MNLISEKNVCVCKNTKTWFYIKIARKLSKDDMNQ